MTVKVLSIGLKGLEGYRVQVEVDVVDGDCGTAGCLCEGVEGEGAIGDTGT